MKAIIKINWSKEDRKVIRDYYNITPTFENRTEETITKKDISNFLYKCIKKYVKRDYLKYMLKSNPTDNFFDMISVYTFEDGSQHNYNYYYEKLMNGDKEMYEEYDNLRKNKISTTEAIKIIDKKYNTNHTFNDGLIYCYRTSYNLYKLFNNENFINSEDYITYKEMVRELIEVERNQTICGYLNRFNMIVNDVDENSFTINNYDYTDEEKCNEKCEEMIKEINNYLKDGISKYYVWFMNRYEFNIFEKEFVTPDYVVNAFNNIEAMRG